MKYFERKHITAILVLGLAVSLSGNIYFYWVALRDQASLHNMQGYAIVAWGEKMGRFWDKFRNAGTSDDVQARRIIDPVLTVGPIDVMDGALYENLSGT